MDLNHRLQATLTDYFWIPDHVHIVERPEVSFCYSNDPNWFNHVSRLTLPIDLSCHQAQALAAEVDQAHRRGTSRYFMAEEWIRESMIEAIEALGLQRGHTHRACGLRVDRYTPGPSTGLRVVRVQTLSQLMQAHAVAMRAFDKSVIMPPSDAQEWLALSNRPASRSHRFLVSDLKTGEPLATGGVNIYRDLKLGLMWGGGTVPEARGRGAYRCTVNARIELARTLGLDSLALYARENTSLPIMKKLGAEVEGRMTYWERARRSGPTEDTL